MQFSIITIFTLAGFTAAAPTTTSKINPVIIGSNVIDAVTPITPTAIQIAGSPVRSSTFTVPKVDQAVPDDPQYTQAALDGHNIHRANHSAQSLTYNTQLAGYAATVAASCNFAHDLSEGGGGYGQNIAAYGSSDAGDFTDVAMLEVAISDLWYNGEISDFLPSYYGEASPDFSDFEDWGHFTQVIWAATTSVGCATQLCPVDSIIDGVQSYFTVCNYESAGNIDGTYATNVLPPLGQPIFAP